MLYTTSLSRMLDEVFAFPYQTRALDDAFVYDYVKREKDGTTKIEVVVPGYGKEDLKLDVVDNILKLSCELEGKKFLRQWKLSDSVDLERINAECKNGVLVVAIPSRKKIEKTHTVTIN